MVNGEINIRNLFGRNLRRLRIISNKSQIDLANEAELAHNFINDIENGKKWISDKTLAKLVIALRVEPYQFFVSDSKWQRQGPEIISLYLDDFSDSIVKMVKECRHNFPVKGEDNGKIVKK